MNPNNKATSPKIEENKALTEKKWYPNFFYWSAKEGKIKIKLFSLIQYLKSLGFYRYDLNDDFGFIRVVEGVAETYTITTMQDVFFDCLKNLPDELTDGKKDDIKRIDLIEQMYKGLTTYFSKGLLSRLGSVSNLSFLETEKDNAYFFFKNCVVKVSKDGIKSLKYKDLNGKIIWKNSILNNSFRQLSSTEFSDTTFAKYIRNISKSKGKNKLTNLMQNVHDSEREHSLKTIIGYNLHSFFETKLKATILTDTGISDEAEGRTGKTLLVKAMGKMLNAKKESTSYVEISGKNFDFSNKNRYELCQLDTKLVHINDARKKFLFEQLFTDITEGITINGKWIKTFTINAKIVLSSNTTIKLNGGSDKDRAIEFQVSDHYSHEYSPADEFGHWLFRDWDGKVWNEFYNYMIHCVQEYFLNGLLVPENIDLEERKLRAETKPEFVEYMDSCLKNIVHNQDYDKADIYGRFKEAYPDFDTKLRQRTFTDWIKRWSKGRPKIKEITERRSGKTSYIKFTLNLEKNEEELPI